jgi:hypothetical protein
VRFRLMAARTCGPLTGNPAGKQNAVFFQRCGRRPGGARIGRDQAFLGSGE